MRIKNLFFLAALAVSATATLTSCEDILGTWDRPTPAAVTPTASVAVTGITLSETTLNKKVGDAAVTLTATVAPDNASDKTLTWSSDNTAAATVADGVVTIVGTGTALITATAKDGSGVEATCTVNVGLLAGKFSVDNGKQVQFSQGNLQFQASTKTWRFAEHQYDYVGDDTKGNVLVESTKSNNASISDTYTGWIDLFGWGTSGHKYDSGYGSDYQPWSTSTTDTNYGPNGTDNGLYDSFAQGDWGTNMGTGWRTLKSDEWTYLFNTRETGGTVFGTEKARYAHATINTDGTGVNGIILFPDGVDIASSEVTTAGTVNNTSDFATKCTSAQWTALEAKGCVFLPAAGFRFGTSVYTDGRGLYWSSSPDGSNANNAYLMVFGSGSLNPATNFNRSYAFSVRLVRPVE